MAKQYLINFLIRGFEDVIEFEVRESDWLRAQDMFDHVASFYRPSRFLIFDSVEGLAVAINVLDVQLVRFPWNAVEFPSDQKHKEGDVNVWLRGREKPISISTDEEKEALSAFFIILDSDREQGPFPGFTAVDGELALFNAEEVVLVSAPIHEVSEGHRILRQDGEIDGAGDVPF